MQIRLINNPSISTYTTSAISILEYTMYSLAFNEAPILMNEGINLKNKIVVDAYLSHKKSKADGHDNIMEWLRTMNIIQYNNQHYSWITRDNNKSHTKIYNIQPIQIIELYLISINQFSSNSNYFSFNPSNNKLNNYPSIFNGPKAYIIHNLQYQSMFDNLNLFLGIKWSDIIDKSTIYEQVQRGRGLTKHSPALSRSISTIAEQCICKIALFKKVENSDSDAYISSMDLVESFETSGLVKDEIFLNPLSENLEEYYKYLDQLPVNENLLPVLIKTPIILSPEEQRLLLDHYRIKLLDTKIFQDQYKARKRNIEYGYEGTLNIKVVCNRVKEGYQLIASNRMTSKLATYTYDESKPKHKLKPPRKKIKRSDVLAQQGMNANEDLKASVLVLIKTLNGWLFDFMYNITNELLLENFKDIFGVLLNKLTIKGIRLRHVFSTTIEKFIKSVTSGSNLYAFNGKKKRKNHEDEILQKIDKETTIQIKQKIGELIGDHLPFYKVIFPLESLIAMRVINIMKDNGYKIENVYDCYYYDSNEISASDFQLLLSNVIQKTCDEYSFLKTYNQTPWIDVDESFETLINWEEDQN